MEEKQTTTNAKAWIKKETRPYFGRIVCLACITVVTTVLSLAFAYMVRYLINSASKGEANKLWIFSAVLLGTLLLKIALQTVSGYVAEKLRARMTAKLRTRMFSKILRSEYAEVQKYHSGDLMNRLTTDVQEIVVNTVGLLPAVVGMVVQCFGAIAALLTIDVLFTFIYIVCGLIFAGIMSIFRKYIKKHHKEVLQADGETRAFMQEGTGSVMTLKAYGAEGRTTQKAEGLADIYYGKRMKRNALRATMNAVFSLLSNFGLIFAVIWCSVSVLFAGDNAIDYGSILSVILLLMQLQQPLTGFSSLMPAYYARIASAERLQEIDRIDCETLSTEAEDAQTLYTQMDGITFENVDFTYGRDTVLEKANITLEKGKIICLTGPSGAGKSTVFKLLLNVFTPTGGNIYTDGQQRAPLTAKQRGLFAYVPQGNFLFSGTIYENLTFFSEEMDEKTLNERLKEAIDVACAQFVWELPDGLETKLTEGGGGLSEGQTQRLAVARAILSGRPILLLDEATSALDGETEKKLLENVRALKDKTCLIVTHRPAALDIADKILTVEHGKIYYK